MKHFLCLILFLTILWPLQAAATVHVWDSFEGDCAGGTCGTFESVEYDSTQTDGSNTCAVAKIPTDDNPTGVGDYALKIDIAGDGSKAYALYDLGSDKDGYGELETEWSAYGMFEENTANCYGGGFGMVELDYDAREITFTIKDHTGTTFASTCADRLEQNLTYTFSVSFTFIDEGFEELGGEEDWLTWLIYNTVGL